MARSRNNTSDDSAGRAPGAALRTIVVKIGSAVIAPGGMLEPARVRSLAIDITTLVETGHRVVIVSSGAVASGFRSLGLENPPKTLVDKQAAAAIGQPLLMHAWGEAFAACRPQGPSGGTRAGRSVAQVLLTAEDVEHRGRFLNARRTLERLLDAGVIPVINENDSVSFDEIKLGDNDRLSALTATLVSADTLVLLSSVPGVLSGSGASARVVPEIRTLADGLALVRPEKTATGVGGMETKVRAACAAAALGIETFIAMGSEAGVLPRLLAQPGTGTRFVPAAAGRVPSSDGRESGSARAGARKKWLGLSARARGKLIVDEGAARALRSKGSSLLPSGIVDVVGDFDAGALVEICAVSPGASGDSKALGEPFARGLACYPSADLRKLRGLKTSQIQQVLGYHYSDEAVHRDDFVLLSIAEPRGDEDVRKERTR